MRETFAAPSFAVRDNERPLQDRPLLGAVEVVVDQGADDRLGWDAVQFLADGPDELGAST